VDSAALLTHPEPAPSITLAIHNAGVDARRVMATEVARGLSSTPKQLPSRYFYDARGCELFDLITELPEYYLTRAETEILTRHADQVVSNGHASALVELGAGSCAKSRILIEAGLRSGDLRHFVPFDISEGAVLAAAHDLVASYPGLRVHGLVGDFAEHVRSIPRLGRQLVLFLGSTIGNMDEVERARFLAEVRSLLEPEDRFLLGVDLVKDESELEAAYNDGRGLTADFNLNMLSVLNRELGADFDPGAFEHVAIYDRAAHRIEMNLRARRRLIVEVPVANTRVAIAQGECLRTEISTKFTYELTRDVLAAADMDLRSWLTDERSRFGVAIASPRGAVAQAG
jgi:L-histidine N-alpha-methyltransferase